MHNKIKVLSITCFCHISPIIMNSELNTSKQLIQKHFEIDFTESSDSYEKILNKLCKQVGWLLDHDFQSLLNALYRIDVNEEKFKQILAVSAPDKIALEIAELILARIIKKAKTRLYYSSK